MNKRHLIPQKTTVTIFALMFVVALLTIPVVEAQQPDSTTLHMQFTKAQEFDVPYSDLKIRIDLENFELTYDSQPEDRILFVAGNSERHMVVKVTADTLYTDIDRKPSEYRELWWYFYTLDSTLDIGKVKVWDENERNWSTHTLLTSNNFEINERHYDLFEIKDNYSFHVSVKRPLYLEGDSTLMLDILNSFEIISPESGTQKPTEEKTK